MAITKNKNTAMKNAGAEKVKKVGGATKKAAPADKKETPVPKTAKPTAAKVAKGTKKGDAKKAILGSKVKAAQDKKVKKMKMPRKFYDKDGNRLGEYDLSRVDKTPYRKLIKKLDNKRKVSLGASVVRSFDHTFHLKWPKYIRLQKQKKIMKLRLRVPPAINHFSFQPTLTYRKRFVKFFKKYSPETAQQKQTRLRRTAELVAKGKPALPQAPKHLTFGINEVTKKIEKKEALLVVIANDVEPMELVVWLPALCRKMNVPYIIMRNTAVLGKVVGQKTCSAICITDVYNKDTSLFDKILKLAKMYNRRHAEASVKQWGGNVRGDISRTLRVMNQPKVPLGVRISDWYVARQENLKIKREKRDVKKAAVKAKTAEKKVEQPLVVKSKRPSKNAQKPKTKKTVKKDKQGKRIPGPRKTPKAKKVAKVVEESKPATTEA